MLMLHMVEVRLVLHTTFYIPPLGVITWLKLSRALCRLACMPVGGSLVILMEFSRIPCGMMWPSGVEEGSALTNTLKFSWLPSACCSRSFSKVPSQRATKWIFCRVRNRKRPQQVQEYRRIFACY